ncbi:lysophospholipid acyltransferase family protein [Coprobacter tertius]|uniref:1-acyl-sn-glycerol-3-phosphate acyltransferase n=1 Tax=Coprobacter tertius TaxID=2944915 RepID=A0ABT1MEY8_9BACT|nr:lysophospholipid acyltransferase family protein [Coprobacter tertius]MCP9611195.1 1-acyl-sn-glycerol-3-phosphate acyltransferase [Coprobacter tertius]
MKVIFFFYQWLIALPILLVLTLLTAITTIIGSFLGSNRFWGYYPGRIWSKLFCIFSLVKVEVRGRKNIDKKTSYVFVANHQGAYDIFLIYGYLGHNFKWLMKKSLRKIPFVGKACEAAGHIFVDRSGPKSIHETLVQAEKTLQDGMSVVVFPEGSRTTDGKLHRFKKGAYQLAIDLNLPVVPLTIDGSFKVLPRNSYLITPGKMILTIHKPIFPIDGQGHDIQELMHKSYQEIESVLPQEGK